MNGILQRIRQLADHEGIAITALEQLIGASKGVLSKAIAKNTDIQSKWLVKIVENYPHCNAAWLLSGKGTMLTDHNSRNAHLIPLYDDVGEPESILSEDGQGLPAGYIDPGDWFMDATAAIRYYSAGMKEYPPGCLLILRQKADFDELVWGEHYMIEYGENRILRAIQPSEDKTHIYAYATNEATYPDGKAKYPPLPIPFHQIKNIFQVLGHICKRQGSNYTYGQD